MKVLSIIGVFTQIASIILVITIYRKMYKNIKYLEKRCNKLHNENIGLTGKLQMSKIMINEKENIINSYTNIIMSLEEELSSLREEAYKSKKTMRKSTTSTKAK